MPENKSLIDAARELLPCPFCGYEASMTNVESAASGRYMWVVGCNSEDCDVSFHGHARQVDAAKAWNTRVTEQQIALAVAEERKRLLNKLEEMRRASVSGLYSMAIADVYEIVEEIGGTDGVSDK